MIITSDTLVTRQYLNQPVVTIRSSYFARNAKLIKINFIQMEIIFRKISWWIAIIQGGW